MVAGSLRSKCIKALTNKKDITDILFNKWIKKDNMLITI